MPGILWSEAVEGRHLLYRALQFPQLLVRGTVYITEYRSYYLVWVRIPIKGNNIEGDTEEADIRLALLVTEVRGEAYLAFLRAGELLLKLSIEPDLDTVMYDDILETRRRWEAIKRGEEEHEQ